MAQFDDHKNEYRGHKKVRLSSRQRVSPRSVLIPTYIYRGVTLSLGWLGKGAEGHTQTACDNRPEVASNHVYCPEVYVY